MKLKKILSAFLAMVMVFSTVVFTTSSVTTIEPIFSDNFDEGFLTRNWVTTQPECSFSWDKFGKCIIGFDDAVVLQSNAGTKYNKWWASGYMAMDFQIRDFDDYMPEHEGRTHNVALWYRDLFEDSYNNTGNSGAVYMYTVEIETGKATLTKEHTWDYYDEMGVKQTNSTNVVLAEGYINTEIDVGGTAPFYELGWRITQGKIECYFDGYFVISAEADPNDPKYGDFTFNSVDETVGTQKSPFLFWNTGNYVALDNFEVWPSNYHIGHETGIIGADDPTCTEPGHTGYTICFNCNEVLDYGESIPATGHSYNGVVTVEPSVDPGVLTYTCENCGDSYDEEIPAIGYDPKQFVIDENGMLVSYIGDGSDVVIPDVVTSIGEGAFANHTGLTSVTISGNVTLIGDYSFEGCTNLTSVTISDSVTRIANNAFLDCSNLTSIIVDENNSVYTDIDGILFTKDNKTLVCYPAGKADTKYTIPESVATISGNAFYNCTNLTSITIPETVTHIDSGAFYNCTNLIVYCYDNTHAYIYSLLNGIPFVIIEHEFIIEDGILTKYNGNSADVIIPDGVTVIGASAFAFTSGIKSVTIPEGVTMIGTGAFSFCPGLEKVVLPSTLETIDTGAFAFCPALSDITIPESVTLIGDGAFDCCYALGEIRLSDNVETIGADAFNGCEALTLRCYSTAPAATYAEENDVNYRLIISGDSDDNGVMDANDLVYLSKIANGASLDAGYGADADRNGVVNADDLVLISKVANGVAIG